ncbi:acid sphingomyelinase-like phosphodiesterase 3b [Saccostrea cucullata]|uniref:acid sphingomyelinase-like phosphodiesterase 3b n=1 Tax=Saccostrea cuccullata TaxID=36930 RepID=UPI002ED6B60C
MNFLSIVLFAGIVIEVCASSVDTGYFWQVTDFHYDANYSTKGDPLRMCHDMSGGSYSNSIYGNYHCDSPWKLIQSATAAMKRIHPNPDFILWTGDSVPHVADSDLDLQKVQRNIGNITLHLRFVFPDTKIYPVLGNHDEYPKDAYPPAPGSDYYKGIIQNAHFDQLLTNDTAKQFLTGGYYTTLIHPGLRVMGLNTNLLYSQDKLTANSDDPAGQFQWMDNTLTKARTAKEKVIILSHVPPGVFEKYNSLMWFYDKFNIRYVRILQKFSDIITAQIYGHEHTDSFRILKDTQGSPVGTLFLAPAVTPWNSSLAGVGANNPSLRLYIYNKTDGTILNYKQYYLDLASLIHGVGNTNWTLEYDAQRDYQLPDLSPKSMNNLAVSFNQDNSAMFLKYLTFNSVSQTVKPGCDSVCKLTHVCSITELELLNFKLCQSSETTRTTQHPGPTPSHRHRRPVGKMYIYIIIGLGAVVFLLFIVVAIVCIRRRRHFVPHRFSRFSNSLGSGPIN